MPGHLLERNPNWVLATVANMLACWHGRHVFKLHSRWGLVYNNLGYQVDPVSIEYQEHLCELKMVGSVACLGGKVILDMILAWRGSTFKPQVGHLQNKSYSVEGYNGV